MDSMPLSVRQRSHRSLDQRLLLRFPQLSRLNLRLFARLPPSSRVRQAVLRRSVRLGVEAFNRRDIDALLIPCHPDAQFEPPRELVQLGVGQARFGLREGLQRLWSEFFPAWGQLRLEPRELLDLGDRIVLFGEMRGSGASSGAALSTPYATILTLERGWIVRQQEFLNDAEAREAAGLAPPTASSAQPAQKSS